MAGMELLGRMVNIIPVAAGAPFKFRSASVAMFVISGATAAPTINERTSFGGSDTAISVIKNVYWTTANNGTAAWSKLTYVSGTAPFTSGPLSTYTHGTTTGLTTATVSVFHVFSSELSDPNNYLNCAVGGSGTGIVVVGDLVHQRPPANLEILGA
jgi:hypothetical protein